MTPLATLLHAVARLHADGYGQVRVHAYVYQLGTWRCELQVRRRTGEPVADPFFRYTSATLWRFFEQDEGPVDVDRVAAGLLSRIPDPEAARRPSPGYVFWFAALLERCGPSAVPVFSEEDFSSQDAGYVRIVGDGSGPRRRDRFPLPPTV